MSNAVNSTRQVPRRFAVYAGIWLALLVAVVLLSLPGAKPKLTGHPLKLAEVTTAIGAHGLTTDIDAPASFNFLLTSNTVVNIQVFRTAELARTASRALVVAPDGGPGAVPSAAVEPVSEPSRG
ncbi:MAG: hypothetical protein H7123_08740, partial [Thermoleophilia bacterium]|nr:hypothetical protein [Thermoleophilia bacterium]